MRIIIRTYVLFRHTLTVARASGLDTLQIEEETRMGDVELGAPEMSVPVVSHATCLRCDSDDTVQLEKARTEANTCYRCRGCGHIFSPIGS